MSLWAAIKDLFVFWLHVHDWRDEEKRAIMRSNGVDIVGYQYIQKCAVPRCGKRRFRDVKA